jgi:hypothetical protein
MICFIPSQHISNAFVVKEDSVVVISALQNGNEIVAITILFVSLFVFLSVCGSIKFCLYLIKQHARRRMGA